MPAASKILEGVTLDALLSDYFYAEARALALTRLETSASLGIIDVEGPPTNDESDIVDMIFQNYARFETVFVESRMELNLVCICARVMNCVESISATKVV